MKRLVLFLVFGLVTGACAASDAKRPGMTGSNGGAGTSGAGGDGGASTGGATGDGGTPGTQGAAGVTGGGGLGGATGAGGAAGLTGVGGLGGVTGAGGAAGLTGAGGLGGTTGSGGTTGTAGMSGAGGGASVGGMAGGTTGGTGGASSHCTAVPVTPNATEQARRVLCYLYDQYGNHILSGQQESGGDVEISYIFASTGKYPAVRAFEADNDGAATRCLSYWNANGLCLFGYHMGAPSTSDGYEGSTTTVNGGIDSVLTPGTSNNTVFNQRLDAIANRLLLVEAGNGVVLFQPFREAGSNFFWWSREGGEQYVRLWKYAFDRIVNLKGVRNAIWLFGYNFLPKASFYPGAAFVDVGGADTYNRPFDYSPLTALFDSARNIFGTTMPIALQECGPVPDPDLLQSTRTNWLMFNVWMQPFPELHTTVAQLQKVYGSSYVVSRDEMPNLRR